MIQGLLKGIKMQSLSLHSLKAVMGDKEIYKGQGKIEELPNRPSKCLGRQIPKGFMEEVSDCSIWGQSGHSALDGWAGIVGVGQQEPQAEGAQRAPTDTVVMRMVIYIKGTDGETRCLLLLRLDFRDRRLTIPMGSPTDPAWDLGRSAERLGNWTAGLVFFPFPHSTGALACWITWSAPASLPGPQFPHLQNQEVELGCSRSNTCDFVMMMKGDGKVYLCIFRASLRKEWERIGTRLHMTVEI